MRNAHAHAHVHWKLSFVECALNNYNQDFLILKCAHYVRTTSVIK